MSRVGGAALDALAADFSWLPGEPLEQLLQHYTSRGAERLHGLCGKHECVCSKYTCICAGGKTAGVCESIQSSTSPAEAGRMGATQKGSGGGGGSGKGA